MLVPDAALLQSPQGESFPPIHAASRGIATILPSQA